MKRFKIMNSVFFLMLAVVLLSCACAVAEEEEYPPAYPLPELSGNMLEDFLAVARSQVGYTASETNLSEYWVWADGKGSNHNWCSDFVSWCAAKANIPETMLPHSGSFTVFRNFLSALGRYYKFENECTSSIDGCLELSSGTVSVEDLLPGDLILIENDNIDDGPDHVAIVEKVEEGVITILDGNVKKANDDKKIGQVYERILNRDKRLIHGVCRIFVNPDSSSISSFVSRCYSLILGRDADVGGLTDWTNQLTSGTANASQIISGFLNSEEFINQNSSNPETVDILYNTMLNRPADEAGKEYWVNILNGSGSSTVINGFCGSQEFLALCQEYGIEAGSVAIDNAQTGTGIDGFVARCYSEALGRTGDEGGIAYWKNILTSKEQTPQQVAAGFVFSQEMDAASKLVNNPDALLDSLYKLYLGRPADEAGKEYWKQRIAEGLSLEDLNAGFANSTEFTSIVASYGLE